MPLSEQEQRLLDEMERNLLSNDADVVTATGAGRSFSYRNLVYGALLVVVGLGVLVGGVIAFQGLAMAQWIGIAGAVVGFVMMFGGVMLGMRRASTLTPEAAAAPREKAYARQTKRDSESFMDRMNDRWDRRHDSDR